MRPLVPEDLRLNDANPAIVLPWLLRIRLWATKSTLADAIDRAIACRAPSEAVRIAKAPVGADSTRDPGYQHASQAFISTDTMQTQSVFFRGVADRAFQPGSFNTRAAYSAALPVAVEVTEGYAKPIVVSRLSFLTLRPRKMAAGDAITNEMLADIGVAGQRHIVEKLRQAVAVAVDGGFLAGLLDTGTTSTPSSGSSAINAHADVRAAARLVATSGAGRYYIAVNPTVAVAASTLATTTGAPAFPEMSPQGGSMCGMPCVVSGGVPAGEAFVIDASGIVAAAGQVEPRESREADMLMANPANMSSTGPAPAMMSSLWQDNCTGFIAEASFGAVKLRDDCVALITGINWGGP